VTQLKILLVSTMVVGLLGFVAVPRVWALFTAETSNLNATATSGTLTLDFNANATDCFSYSSGALGDNENDTCTLRADTVANELYPGDISTTTVTIKDTGSVAASELRVFMPGGCTNVTTASATTGGGANPCTTNGLMFYIQETTGSTKCWFPTVANGACSLTASSLSTFATTRTTAVNGLSLGAGPAAQGTRTFVIGVQLPSTVNNTYQGQAAKFSVAFHMTS